MPRCIAKLPMHIVIIIIITIINFIIITIIVISIIITIILLSILIANIIYFCFFCVSLTNPLFFFFLKRTAVDEAKHGDDLLMAFCKLVYLQVFVSSDQ